MSIIFSRANPTGLIAACDTEYKKDIEDIRADDITKCHIDFVLSGGNDGGDKLRKTGSHGNDRKSNQCLAKSQTGCDCGCPVNDEITAIFDRNHTAQYENETFP